MKPLREGFVALAIVSAAFPGAAQAEPDIQRGRDLVQTHCAECHATGATGESPLALAPPFRDLHRRYAVEHLEEAFAEGISTGHEDMPEFRFEPDEIRDLIAYLQSLQ